MFIGRIYSCERAPGLTLRMPAVLHEAGRRAQMNPYAWSAQVTWVDRAKRHYGMLDVDALSNDVDELGEPTLCFFALEDDERDRAQIEVRLDRNQASCQAHGFDTRKQTAATAVVEEFLLSRGAVLLVSTDDGLEDVKATAEPARADGSAVGREVSQPASERSALGWIESHPAFVTGVVGLLGVAAAIAAAIISS